MTSKQYLATKQPKPVETVEVEVIGEIKEIPPDAVKGGHHSPLLTLSSQLTAYAAHWNRVAAALSASGHRSQDDMAVIYHAGWLKNIALDLADWTRAAKPDAIMPVKEGQEPVVTTAHKRRTK